MNGFDVGWALAGPPVLCGLPTWIAARGRADVQRRACLWWALDAVALLAAYLSIGQWVAAGCAGLNLIIALALWWHRRRKRRSAAALIGAKSKAARDALVRKARETARPRPVLRPVPGGAR